MRAKGSRGFKEEEYLALHPTSSGWEAYSNPIRGSIRALGDQERGGGFRRSSEA
jgi:hypothetical protein